MWQSNALAAGAAAAVEVVRGRVVVLGLQAGEAAAVGRGVVAGGAQRVAVGAQAAAVGVVGSRCRPRRPGYMRVWR